MLAASQRSLQDFWACAGLATGDLRDAEQTEQKFLAVVPMRVLLSKTRGSESVCTGGQCGSHTGSKKPSAVHWQVQERVGAGNPEGVCGLEVGFWSRC